MATFTVTQNIDNGLGDVSGSLSWAIEQANLREGADTIQLATDVTLTNRVNPLIDSDITIQGSGMSTDGDNEFNISGGNNNRPLFIKSGTVNINDVDIVEGLAEGEPGGGGGAGLGGGLFIYSGNVTLSNVDIANNRAVGGEGNYGADGGYSIPLFSGGTYDPDSRDGGDGGFGSGGSGSYYSGDGGFGGFGGGGGGGGLGNQVNSGCVFCYTAFYTFGGKAGKGGFGGGDGGRAGQIGSIGAYASPGLGGGGGGLGGGLFIRTGNLTLEDVDFTNNSAEGGRPRRGDLQATSGLGLGGGLFALHITRNTNRNNVGMPDRLPVVNITSATFLGNVAGDAENTAQVGIGENLNNNAVFGTTALLIDPETPTPNSITGTNRSDTLRGTTGNDGIFGLGGDDVLNGARGNDTIAGDGGNDRLLGGQGDDILDGGRGNDSLIAGSGNDLLTGFTGNDLLQGDAGNDLLIGGQGRDRLLGGSGNDVLLGGTGKDLLTGGVGDDRLEGGEGRDVLIGGNGRDTFVIASGGRLPVRDVISDFIIGQDKIEVLGLSFGALGFSGNRISIEETGEVIASLTGIETTTLSAADFV